MFPDLNDLLKNGGQKVANGVGLLMLEPGRVLKTAFTETVGVLAGVSAMAASFTWVHTTFNRFTFEDQVYGTKHAETMLKNTCNAADPVDFDLIQAGAHAVMYKAGAYDAAYFVGNKVGKYMAHSFTEACKFRVEDKVQEVINSLDDLNDPDSDAHVQLAVDATETGTLTRRALRQE